MLLLKKRAVWVMIYFYTTSNLLKQTNTHREWLSKESSRRGWVNIQVLAAFQTQVAKDVSSSLLLDLVEQANGS